MNPLEHIRDVFDQFAERYAAEYMGKDLHFDTLASFCHQIQNKHANILELACGPGNLSQFILQENPGFRLTGIDISPNMISLARQLVPEAQFIVLDVMQLSSLKKQYDAVVSGFCYPYLDRNQVKQNIKDIGQVLMQHGLFYISTIAGDYSESNIVPSSTGEGKAITMYYYDQAFLEELLIEQSFEILESTYRSREERDGRMAQDIIITARYNGEG